MRYKYLGEFYNNRYDLAHGIVRGSTDYDGMIELLERKVDALTMLVGLLLERSEVTDSALVDIGVRLESKNV